ncbi:lysylphosphatidylglycerol synthase domain-containing protein [Cryobacterium ruanii]|uniref:UPF0104 family protein n=1 Tax=Cryobacterium ruanii TaxID=1259197 RepID=A0A4R9APV3_9MICO|nr:lysylphosphatidylglycerol synthase domain-containing protein [Cryobacterium ruanii]TFD67297.1 UPF0104 family protein [Cryobacterium ruanii]
MTTFKSIAPRIFLVMRYVLLAAVVGFAVLYLVNQWSAVSAAMAEISWQSFTLSFVVLLFGLAAGTMSWVSVLNGLGPRVPVARAAQVMLVGQLGKYVPGSVWSYVMQMELGRQHGILRPRVLVAGLYAAGIGVVASLILGALALPVVLDGHSELLWLFLLLPIGLVCLHPLVMTWLASLVLKMFRRQPLEHKVTFRVVGQAVGWALVSYALYGVHLWILVNSLVDPDFGTLVLLTGAMALGFTVGLFAFVFPSGVGVREAILVGVMTLLLTIPQGTAMSLVSRMMFTAADLLAAGVAVLFVITLRKKIALDAARFHSDEAYGFGPEGGSLERESSAVRS